MTWSKWERAAEKGPMSLFWKAFWASVVVFVVGGVVFGVISLLGNPMVQAKRVLEKTIDADNVIYNYEWFRDRYNDIGSYDAKIASSKASVANFTAALPASRKEWDREDKIEYARLSSVLLGLRQQRNDLAAEYNSRAKMANRKIFKSNDLPNHIPLNGE